jgi:hypothetical protein
MQTTFKRESFSSALVNTDTDALEAYKKRRESQKKIQQIERDINTLKYDISDIKLLLQQIINRG